jgi:hypothetical protein
MLARGQKDQDRITCMERKVVIRVRAMVEQLWSLNVDIQPQIYLSDIDRCRDFQERRLEEQECHHFDTLENAVS